MNIAYLDPPYSRYFHGLARCLAPADGDRRIALLSSPAYRLYIGDDEWRLWEPGESPARWRLPQAVSRLHHDKAAHPRFGRVFAHAVRWFREQLVAERIELVLIYSDARVFSAAARIAADELGLPSVYFERGAFRYRTASLSTTGLNGRFSLTAAAEAPIEGIAADDPLLRRPTEPWLRTRFAVFLTLNVLANWRQPPRRLLRPRNLLLRHYLRLGIKQLVPLQRGAMPLKRALPADDAPVVFLPLQLSADTQMLLYSPFAGNQALIDFVVAQTASVCPTARVLINRHPMDLIDYRIPPGAVLVDAPAHRLIPRASAVVCVNSTAGFEAAIVGKPVLCFGASFYADSRRVMPVSKSNYAGRLRAALAAGDDAAAGLALKADVLRCYQVPGDVWAYTAEDLRRAAGIVRQHVAGAVLVMPAAA